jgi:hypothetical protein
MSIRSDEEDLRRPSLFSRAASFITGKAPNPAVSAPAPAPAETASDEGDIDIPADDAPTPDLIEVRTERWSVFRDSMSPANPNAITWVIAEPPAITYEPRLPEDGDSAYRIVRTPKPIAPLEAKRREPEGRDELKKDWLRSDWKPGVHESLLRKSLGPEDPEASSHNDSTSAWRWGRTFGR